MQSLAILKCQKQSMIAFEMSTTLSNAIWIIDPAALCTMLCLLPATEHSTTHLGAKLLGSSNVYVSSHLSLPWESQSQPSG